MRIVIDMQGAQTAGRFRGIGRYTMGLTKAIVRNRKEHEVILALSAFVPETARIIRWEFDGLLPAENIRVWYAPGSTAWGMPHTLTNRKVAEAIYASFISSLQPDVLLVTSVIEGWGEDAVFTAEIPNRSFPIAIIDYDLIPYLNPKEYFMNTAWKNWYLDRLQCLRNADIVLSISDYSKNEFVSNMQVEPSKVINIGCDADSNFYFEESTPEINQWLRSKGIVKDFLLYTGGADERKNTDSLVIAYSHLPQELREKHQLVLVCGVHEHRINFLNTLAQQNKLLPEELIVLGFLSIKELRQLYSFCKLFVFPSLYEGFGLTVLEAMRCGAPVIGSDCTSIPEVIGTQKALFNPRSAESITKKIEEVLSSDVLLNQLRKHCTLQSRKFSWDKTAQKGIAEFEKRIQIMPRQKKMPHYELIPQVCQAVAALISSDFNCLQLAHDLDLTFETPRQQRQLLIDVSELVQRDSKTGIQRVVRSVLQELLTNPPEGCSICPVYASSFSKGYLYANKFTAAFQGRPLDEQLQDTPVAYSRNDIFLGLDFQSVIVPRQHSYLREMSIHGVSIYFVVYDLLPVLRPEFFPKGTAEGHIPWLHCISEFDGVICISKAVADEYAEWLNLNRPKERHRPRISWFHLGSDITNSVPTKGLPDNAQEMLNKMKQRPTFLMVSTIEPRKGYAQALAAFELLWSQGQDINLVIVGREGWNVSELTAKIACHPEKNKRLFWLKGISDEYLEKVYDAASAVLMASEGEGFGLAVVEGAKHRKPLILRNLPVFQEIAGRQAFYFNGLSSEELSYAVKQWLQLFKENQCPQSANIKCFTWKESTKNLLRQLQL